MKSSKASIISNLDNLDQITFEQVENLNEIQNEIRPFNKIIVKGDGEILYANRKKRDVSIEDDSKNTYFSKGCLPTLKSIHDGQQSTTKKLLIMAAIASVVAGLLTYVLTLINEEK